MQDLLLWKQLLSLEPTALSPAQIDTLHDLLLQSKNLPDDQKIAYSQRLISRLPHFPPSLQAATYTFLGGSHGPMAWAFWLDALSQATPHILPSILRAYRQSCTHDPARWVHALFHPALQVRLQTLSMRPEGFPPHYEWLLFTDPNAQTALTTRFQDAPPQEQEIITLLQLHQAQSIDTLTLQPWLQQAFLQPHNTLWFLHHLPSPHTNNAYIPPDPDALWRHLASAPHPSDLLDSLLALLWPTENSTSEACAVFLRSACLAIQQNKLSLTQHLRLAHAVVRIGSRSNQWSEDAARLLLSAIPRLFGTRYLPLALRQQAARQMLDCRPAVRLFDPLAEWIDTPLCFRPDGDFDLAVIAGLMGLDKSNPFQHLLSHIQPQALFETVLQHPEDAVRMLRLEPHSSVDKLSYDALLRLILQKAQTSPDLIAHALLHLPHKPLTLFCERMAEQPPTLDLLLDHLNHLLTTLPISSSRKDRKIEQIAPLLARTLSPRYTRPLLHALASSEPNALSLEILEQVSRFLPPETLANKIAQLPLRALRSMLSLIEQADGFSLEAAESIGTALQHHPDPSIQTWLRQQQHGRLAQGSDLRQRTEDLPQPLPEAASQRIARCAEHELDDALRITYDLPAKGLCRALQRRKRTSPHAEVLAALLLCHDPLHLVLEQWKRFSDDSPTLYEQLDQIMAARCPSMRSLPLFGLVWMHRWEQHLQTLASTLLQSPKALSDFLQQGLQIPITPLRWCFWQAASLLFKKWRWHPPDLLSRALSAELEQILLAVVTRGQTTQHITSPFLYDESLQSLAADILISLQQIQPAQAMMRNLHAHLLPFLSSLPDPLRNTLNAQLRKQGFSLKTPRPSAHSSQTANALLHSIRQTHNPDALALYCLEDHPQVAEAAALQLISLGESGLSRLLPLLSPSTKRPDPPQLRKLLQLVPLWEDSPSLRHLRHELQKTLDTLSSLSPPSQSLSPISQSLSPTSQSLSPTSQSLSPLPQSLPPLGNPSIDLQRCFLLTLAFIERGERSLLAVLPKIARTPTAFSLPIKKRSTPPTTSSHSADSSAPLSHLAPMWFTSEDWDHLLRIGITEQERALWFAASDQYNAYAPAVLFLLHALSDSPAQTAHTPDTPSQTAQTTALLDALEGFLLCGPSRLEELRLQAAQRLLRYGRLLGYPLLLRTALSSPKSNEELQTLFPSLSSAILEETGYGLLFNQASPHHEQAFLQAVATLPITSEQKERIAQPFLQHSRHPATQERALALHDLPKQRTEALQQIARICAWGIRLGRQITGKVFRIRLIAGHDLGYTRLETPIIFINPLPFLRKERNAETILKALILHEFGHHLYHASPASREIWKQAQKEGIQPLLNLVADEHLERNLRAMEPEFGQALQTLAAYGFQHNQREIRAFFLLDQLGPLAFDALTHSPPTAARTNGCIRIHTGGLLREAERRGFGFSRFMRALRMGHGNRFRDPLVAKALNLFNKDFRHLDMQGLYQVALKLRDIFSYAIHILDDLDTENTLGSDLSEIFRDGYGINDEELQRAIEEEIHPRPHPLHSNPHEIERRNINLSKELHFSPIHHVQTLIYSAEAAQPYLQQVAHESRRLRQYLHKLGLHLQPQKRRIQGHHIDTNALRSAILRGDPRFLTARRSAPHTDLFLGVLIDASGSMNGDHLEKAKAFASLIAEATRSIEGIDTRFFGFNDTTLFDAGDARHCAVHALQSAGGNNDAAALLHLAKLAIASKRKARILVMISDGSPTECSVAALTALVQRITQKMQTLCAQVAVRPLPSVSFPHHVEITTDDLALSTHRFGQLIARLVSQSLRHT